MQNEQKLEQDRDPRCLTQLVSKIGARKSDLVCVVYLR